LKPEQNTVLNTVVNRLIDLNFTMLVI
jgi:hypothetical protein